MREVPRRQHHHPIRVARQIVGETPDRAAGAEILDQATEQLGPDHGVLRDRAAGQRVPGIVAVGGEADRIADRRLALNMKPAGDDVKRQDEPRVWVRYGGFILRTRNDTSMMPIASRRLSVFRRHGTGHTTLGSA